MTRRLFDPPLLAGLLAALATSAVALALNLSPRCGVISTPDDGVWPGSWRLEYGWPSTAYAEFGYDAAIRMLHWTPEGVVRNSALAAVAALTVFLLVLAASGLSAGRRAS